MNNNNCQENKNGLDPCCNIGKKIEDCVRMVCMKEVLVLETKICCLEAKCKKHNCCNPCCKCHTQPHPCCKEILCLLKHIECLENMFCCKDTAEAEIEQHIILKQIHLNCCCEKLCKLKQKLVCLQKEICSKHKHPCKCVCGCFKIVPCCHNHPHDFNHKCMD